MFIFYPFYFVPINHRNEQLRDGLLSLVHSYSLLENKLDRHEQRERALGDVIKRYLQTLQKGQKIFEPIRGTFSRLDERLSQIESVLMAQDVKYNEQQQEIRNSLDAIKTLLENNSKGDNVGNAKAQDGAVNELSQQVQDLSTNVKDLRKEISELLQKHSSSDETSKALLEQSEKLVNSKLASADEVISRMEEKLSHFYVTGPVNSASNDHTSEWEGEVTKSLQEIKTNVNALKASSNAEPVSSAPLGLDKEFLINLSNQTLDAIADMRSEILAASDKSLTKTTSRIKESTDKLDGSINEVLKALGDSGDDSQDGVKESIAELKKELGALTKLEQMLAQMGDNVLSVKRGMEFNVHAITIEVGDVIRSNSKELNETINSRFDAINKTISSNHIGALANLTSKIETEISQVWRQIGIMYQEVSSSKDALNKLQERTETYVNGTFVTMDSMEGKVLYPLTVLSCNYLWLYSI